MKPIKEYVEEPGDTIMVFRNASDTLVKLETFGDHPSDKIEDAVSSAQMAMTIMATFKNCPNFQGDLYTYLIEHLKRNQPQPADHPHLQLVPDIDSEEIEH